MENSGYSSSAALSKAKSYIGTVQSGLHSAGYAKGGLITDTGIAMVHGTAVNPERVLSASQTKLFEGLVQSLQEISVKTPSMPAFDSSLYSNGEGGYNFGDINISVERLDSDEDYDELAEKVKASMMEALGKGRAVGGITLR